MPNGTEFIRALENHRAQALAIRPGPEALPDRLLVSWIHHDNMLEGRLFRPAEIAQALEGEDDDVDRYLHPLLRKIRRYKSAIEFVCAEAQSGLEAVTVENLKTIHKMLTPDPRDRGGLYRRSSPVHRDYFQRICTAEKVTYHLRKLFEQIRTECEEACDPVEFAAEIHERLMFVYPFRRNPGTTARLFTNLLLMAGGNPPAIVPAHQRAEYYKSLADSDVGRLTRILRASVSALLQNEEIQLVRVVN